MSVRMMAKKGFTNPKVKDGGPRGDGTIKVGDRFETDWLHGQELQRLGIAEPEDVKAFDAEPAEAVQPHSSMSEPELRRVNARRGVPARAPALPGSAPPVGAVTGESISTAPASMPKSNVPPLPPASADKPQA